MFEANVCAVTIQFLICTVRLEAHKLLTLHSVFPLSVIFLFARLLIDVGQQQQLSTILKTQRGVFISSLGIFARLHFNFRRSIIDLEIQFNVTRLKVSLQNLVTIRLLQRIEKFAERTYRFFPSIITKFPNLGTKVLILPDRLERKVVRPLSQKADLEEGFLNCT